MEEIFHDLPNAVEVTKDGSQLVFPRSKKLVDAINQHRDYTVVQLLLFDDGNGTKLELILVDVECDDVPPNNQVGIRYRERLALCVPDLPGSLVEVWALREDFPILIHQNHGVVGAPVSLCLYFEPASAVNRTWTPQNFLRRVKWWLEKSARRELHPIDQPVEHLFFSSKFELVLPWNLAELRSNPNLRFLIVRESDRPDGGFTCFLRPLPVSVQRPAQLKTVAHIELDLPPIIQGFVERDPATLGELADILERRGVDLISPLKLALQERVGVSGAQDTDDENGTLILLHIPVQRSSGEEPSLITHRAFLIPVSALSLGVATGALVRSVDGRYYRDGLPQPSTIWKEQLLFSVEVLRQNDSEAARRQSGFMDKGPAGVLIGVGSLGSAILNLWSRSGWGSWTVVDNDHIKPHNLSRHTAYIQHIGHPKVTAVAELNLAVTCGAKEVVPLIADATDFTKKEVLQVLKEATLVIDASATLEYPRLASETDDLPRHLSIFITPQGNAAVLLAEDSERAIRLITLEAQYYRALIEMSWGRDHLGSNVPKFWSGNSCRDISLVLPYARIMFHASTFAEQIPLLLTHRDALIRVWQKDVLTGSVVLQEVAVMPEVRLPFGEFTLSLDTGLVRQLKELRRQNLPNETGGILLGYYDFNVKIVVIAAALSAPIDSKASPGFFERGVAGLRIAVEEASRRTAGVVGYIGEWHSHPSGCSSSPSLADLRQVIYLTVEMAEDGLPAVQLIVGENDLNVLQGACA